MFSTSSQRNYWLFKSEDELNRLRVEAHNRYVNEHHAECPPDKDITEYFLTPAEERTLIRHHETVLRDFCKKFKPPMPKAVVGTAFQYFKRFYLNNSVMDYHPKFMMITCVYLACKVEEFNVSISQFVANLKGDRSKAADIVLNNELLLMQQLKYHLTVHNPFRPIEGFMIDIKTRCLHVGDPERFREYITPFIDNSYSTDACLLYSPSQIALAAIVYAATKFEVNLDSYLTDILFTDAPEKVDDLQQMMTSFISIIRKIEKPAKDQVKLIDKKLEVCRNENNPDNENTPEKLTRGK